MRLRNSVQLLSRMLNSNTIFARAPAPTQPSLAPSYDDASQYLDISMRAHCAMCTAEASTSCCSTQSGSACVAKHAVAIASKSPRESQFSSQQLRRPCCQDPCRRNSAVPFMLRPAKAKTSPPMHGHVSKLTASQCPTHAKQRHQSRGAHGHLGLAPRPSLQARRC